MTRSHLFAAALWCLLSSSGWSQTPCNLDIFCLNYPVFDDDNGLSLYVGDRVTCANGHINCGATSTGYMWYDTDFDGWPEDCPNCVNSWQLASATRRHGLAKPIAADACFCALVPQSITRGGRTIHPRRGVCVRSTRDVQVRGGDGEVFCVRLFEVCLNPQTAGLKGRSRTIQIGFETERTPSLRKTCLDAAPVAENLPCQCRVTVSGQTFQVFTHRSVIGDRRHQPLAATTK